MKKTLLLAALITSSVALGACLPQQTALAVTDEYFVEGGRYSVDFNEVEDADLFGLYTEFDKLPWIMDGKLYAWTLAEQKVIFENKLYTDVDVSVDISTINPSGKFDSGIYVAASGVGNHIDMITAWNVNVEHGAGGKTMDLKLHRFQNGSWKGAIVEIFSLPYTGDNVHLRVVVKDGMLYAFLNYAEKPTFTYEIGETAGLVGLRNFYSPNYFDNFTVIGEGNEVDFTQMNAYQEQAAAALEKNLADTCIAELNAALALANGATTQSQADAACKALEEALERAVEKNTFDGLTALIAQANEIANENGSVYTENSWASLQAVKSICETLTAESSEYDICYWYSALEARINGLIAFLTGGAV